MSGDTFTYLAVMLFCVILSAYFSATETAFSSLNKTKLRALSENGNKKAKLALKLSENYDRLITTILIGNNIVNIATASLGTVLFVHLFGDIGATVSTAVITVVVLIFGEISPKSIAKDSPEKFACFSAPLINYLTYVFTPLCIVFSGWKKLISKIFKTNSDRKMSQEELLMLVEEIEQDGSIDTTESDLLQNAIEFGDRKAEDILTHRVDIEAVSLDTDKKEISDVFYKTRFSRLIVYNENIDDVVGVIHIKDFYGENGITKRSIRDIMTKPVFVQKTAKINNLLEQLQKNKSHVAVVVDEYGGTYGIVTMEDILEELVGEIWDEHDEITEEFKKTGENKYIVDCLVNMDDFCEFFDIETEFDSVSLGGWVMEMLGKIPDIGDSFSHGDITVTVTELDYHRVAFVEVEKTVPPEDETEE